MPFVVSLEDYTPGQRYDGEPWTAARIEQATDREGPFTPIDTITFDDPDEDPVTPKTRSFTTDQATIAAGWFKVVFLDAAAVEQPAEPVYFPSPGMQPTVEEVAALLRARTKDNAGNELGIFTEDTRPTVTDVRRLILQALADVVMRVGAEVPVELEGSARYVVTLRTAAEIERSYQPEQSTDNFSTFQSLRLSYEEALRTLAAAVQIRSLFKPVADEAVS